MKVKGYVSFWINNFFIWIILLDFFEDRIHITITDVWYYIVRFKFWFHSPCPAALREQPQLLFEVGLGNCQEAHWERRFSHLPPFWHIWQEIIPSCSKYKISLFLCQTIQCTANRFYPLSFLSFHLFKGLPYHCWIWTFPRKTAG